MDGIRSVNYITSNAEISLCETYRYFLQRTWDNSNKIMTFIMLNPSSANHLKDDPTIRKCVMLAKKENCSGLYVINLFALRSSQPKDLYNHYNPIGSENDYWIDKIAKKSQVIVAAWGNHGNFLNRDIDVFNRLKSFGLNLYCLGLNKNGTPKHPLARDINIKTKLINYEYY